MSQHIIGKLASLHAGQHFVSILFIGLHSIKFSNLKSWGYFIGMQKPLVDGHFAELFTVKWKNSLRHDNYCYVLFSSFEKVKSCSLHN